MIVAVDAALDVVSGSGAERGIAALVDALNRLPAEDSYLVVTSPLAPQWVAAHTGHRARIVVAPHSFADPTSVRWLRLRARVRTLAGSLLPTARRLTRFAPASRGVPSPLSDPFFKSLGAQVVHFPFQQYVRTGLPCIFEPMDLQHRHLPELLTASELARREATYTVACDEADAVVAPSHWERRDLIAELGLPPAKVYTILRPVPTALAEPPSETFCRAVRKRFSLPESFLLYPAHTWAHKNHLRLLEAVAQARRTTSVAIVCSGTQTEHFAAIKQRLKELDLEEAVRFVGHVTAMEVRALYRLARGLIFPSLHEGASFPLLEAFADDLAVASSESGGLREIAADAAVLFDATSVNSIADAMVSIWTDAGLRERLIRKGRLRLVHFDPVVSARTYRALYRSLAGHALSADDSELLEAARPVDRTV